MERDEPQKGAQEEKRASTDGLAVEDVPDPEEDDLDDLDGMFGYLL